MFTLNDTETDGDRGRHRTLQYIVIETILGWKSSVQGTLLLKLPFGLKSCFHLFAKTTIP